MKITNEIREYIIQEGDTKYSVRHVINNDELSVKIVTPNESHWDRNSMVYFEVKDDFLKKIRETINKGK